MYGCRMVPFQDYRARSILSSSSYPYKSKMMRLSHSLTRNHTDTNDSKSPSGKDIVRLQVPNSHRGTDIITLEKKKKNTLNPCYSTAPIQNLSWIVISKFLHLSLTHNTLHLSPQTPNQPGNLLIQPIHHTHNLSEIPNRGVTYS